jgi:hypothetical protein
VASTATRTGCPYFVLTYDGFDFLLLLTGISLLLGSSFLGVNGLILYTVGALVCFILLLISKVKKYLQNECHLAAKFGTKLADLL